jgi:hypothetical protein
MSNVILIKNVWTKYVSTWINLLFCIIIYHYNICWLYHKSKLLKFFLLIKTISRITTNCQNKVIDVTNDNDHVIAVSIRGYHRG